MKVNAPRLEDRLGPLEPPYRSRGEAQVGRLLDRYGIPFFHEHPVLIYDRGRHMIWHPDFVLPTYNGLIVEYAGMPDIPDYMQGIRRKRRAYRANGIPAVFIYPSHIGGQDWQNKVYHRIMEAARGHSSFMRYPTRSITRAFLLPSGRSRAYRR